MIRNGTPPESAGTESSSRSRALLLVEDEPELRQLVAQVLTVAGYRVTEAADGPEGLARFEGSGPFDLALVDLMLPGFSGVELCRRIKKARPAQPILICSAILSVEHEDDLRRLGIEDFVSKPFLPFDLIQRVGEAVGASSS